MISSKSLRS